MSAMCGATQQQKDITNEQQQFYTDMTNQYNTVFGQDQAITGALTSEFTPILQAGPSQTGFSQGETNALQTQNATNTATSYAAAQKATADILGSQGGGNTLLPSGVTSNLEAQNANQAAQTYSTVQNTNLLANYNQGYQNWNTAANVLGSTAGLLSPTAFANSTTGAGSAAGTSANQVASEANSPWNAAFGALGSVAGSVASAGVTNLGKGVGFFG
jgi:hypothetical protein